MNWLVFALALMVRLAWIWLDQGHYATDLWDWDGRWALALATGEWHGIPQRGLELGWLWNDRGLYFVHRALVWATGGTSYLRLALLQSGIDALAAVVVASLARNWGAGLVYALFPPAIYLAVTPTYSCWLTFGLIFPLWLANRPRWVWLALPIGFATAEVRSISAFWLLFQSKWRMIGPGLGVLVLLSGGNWLIRGDVLPFKGNAGHDLWIGIAQVYDAPVAEPNDKAVGDFYQRLTGIDPAGGFTLDPEYNHRLFVEFIRFVEKRPWAYAWVVASHAGRMIVPNLPLAGDSRGRGVRIGLGLGLALAIPLSFLALPWRLALAGWGPLIYTTAVSAPIEFRQTVAISAWCACLPVVFLAWIWSVNWCRKAIAERMELCFLD